jgi:hypothetical protein
MNDNGLPHDPLSAAQFQMPVLFRQVFSQQTDRTNGEFFAQLSGDFLRVESCDFPARISFNNNDDKQSIPLISGSVFNGNFSGVTIWHDNYAGFTNTRPQIVFNVGRGNDMAVDNLNGSTLIPLPYLQSGVGATGATIDIPAPYSHKRMSLALAIKVTNAAAPSAAFLDLAFFDVNGVALRPQSLTRNAKVYNLFPSSNYQAVVPKAIGATAWEFDYSVVLPVPTQAEFLRIVATYPAVTSTDTVLVSAYGQ